MQYQPGVALMTVSREYVQDEPATALVDARLRAAGSRVVARAWVPATEAAVRAQLVTWISAPAIDAVIVCTDGVTDVATTAVQPLVTEAVPGALLCGKKIVFVMAGLLGALSDTLERVVLPGIATRCTPRARPERIETDKLAVIGDLPAIAPVMLDINLRAGRRGLQLVGLAGVAVAAALCALAVNVFDRHESIVVHHGAADDDVAVVPAAQPAPPPSVPAPPVVASRPIPGAGSASRKPHPPSRAAERPTARLAAEHGPAVHATAPAHAAAPEPRVAAPEHVAVPPELQMQPDDDDSCTEDSCARHGNERECCTPFRTQAAKLDRWHIAKVTSALAAKAHECGSEGVVRLSVQVQPDGSVGKALVMQAPESGVGSCVAAVLHDASFPATGAGGSFVYKVDLAAD